MFKRCILNGVSIILQAEMDSSSMVGGGDVEGIEKAKKRGRAYQCLHCFHKKGKKVIDVKGRLEDHILREHMTFQEVPFYCSLCLFRCLKWEQLVHHVSAYKRHVTMALKGNVVDNSAYLIQNPNPYKFGPLDYHIFTAEESMKHFLEVSTAAESARKDLPLAVQQCIPEGMFDFSNIDSQNSTMQEIPQYIPTPIKAPIAPSIIPVCGVPSSSATLSNSSAVTFASNDPFFQDKPVFASPICENSEKLNESVNVGDTRVVELTSEQDKECNSVEFENDNSKEDVQGHIEETEEESIMQQLLPGDETDLETSKVVPKVEDPETHLTPVEREFDVKDVCEKNLIAVLGQLTEAVNRNTKAVSRMEKLYVDNACLLAKVSDAVTRLKWTMEEREKQEEKREERRQEDDRRREIDRRREERKRRHSEERRQEQKRADRENENCRKMKSVLGSFKENKPYKNS